MKLFPEWLASRGKRRSEPSADPDFADMGTAFGLDASMAHDVEPQAAAQRPAGLQHGPPPRADAGWRLPVFLSTRRN
jgi:hypothetical protein